MLALLIHLHGFKCGNIEIKLIYRVKSKHFDLFACQTDTKTKVLTSTHFGKEEQL